MINARRSENNEGASASAISPTIVSAANKVVTSAFSSFSWAFNFVNARSAKADSEPRIKYNAFIALPLAPVEQPNCSLIFANPQMMLFGLYGHCAIYVCSNNLRAESSQ